MKKIHLKLYWKITLLVIIIVMVSIYTTIFLTTQVIKGNIQKEVEDNIMNVAKIISNSPIVSEGLEKELTNTNEIQVYVQKILATTKNIEVLVVANMEGIRYAHPNPERIGYRIVGGDEIRVIEEGVSYISKATGTLGQAIRAFVPVHNPDGEQIGFIVAGTLTQSVNKMMKQRQNIILLASFVGLFLGGIGAFLLADNIKKTLLGLEPEQISKLYVEKESILDAIHEGIIAIDQDRKISLVNDSAMELLQVNEKKVIGKNVMEIFPTSRLINVLETGEAEYDRDQIINDTIIITNRVPIKEGDKIVGAIGTFRDKTIVTQLAEELTGVNQIVDALRANTHEFMNKLHVILGLMEVGDLQEAKKYIINTREDQQQVLSLVMNKIKDPTLAGLILGKFSKAKELGISMVMEEDSFLDKRNDIINSHSLVTIIGNLLENAMEAVTKDKKSKKIVTISLQEDENNLKIEVKDNGIGIKRENLEKIFIRGYSTKEGYRGVGLALIKELVDNLQGSIEVFSSKKGTEFIVRIPKGEKK